MHANVEKDFFTRHCFFAPFKDVERKNNKTFAVFPTKQERIPLALQLVGLFFYQKLQRCQCGDNLKTSLTEHLKLVSNKAFPVLVFRLLVNRLAPLPASNLPYQVQY